MIKFIQENGEEIILQSENELSVLIGRSDECHVCIAEASVSSRHARLLAKEDKYVISDLGSTNGTLLNGEKLTPLKNYYLKDMDKIYMGKIKLVFRVVSDQPEEDLIAISEDYSNISL